MKELAVNEHFKLLSRAAKTYHLTISTEKPAEILSDIGLGPSHFLSRQGTGFNLIAELQIHKPQHLLKGEAVKQARFPARKELGHLNKLGLLSDIAGFISPQAALQLRQHF